MYLNCHTYFSLNHGVLSVEALVAEAQRCGAERLVLTDIHNTSACFDFVKACREQGIQPLLGIEFHREGKPAYIGIAQNFTGFRELNEFLSRLNLSTAPAPARPPRLNHVFYIWPMHAAPTHPLQDHEFIGVHPLTRSSWRIILYQGFATNW